MQLLRFGEDFELDPGAYQLRRSGQALKLERIPLEILLLLTQRQGQLVTREQIVARIWGESASLDADNSINGVEVGALPPNPCDDLLPCDELSLVLGEEQQDLEGDALQLESLTGAIRKIRQVLK